MFTFAVLAQSGEFLAGDTARAVYWAFALAGTVLFAISAVTLMLGGGAEMIGGDVDVDMDGDIDIVHADTGLFDLKFFSFRTVLAFCTMFGWGGLVFGEYGWGGLLGAILCGLAMMFVTALLISLLLKLQQSGNVSPAQIVGKSGTVYISLPGGMDKPGKVMVNLGDSTREIQAVAEEALSTGTVVQVAKYLGNRCYVVEKQS